MKIELKNIKYFEAGSEETFCFVASLYVDGKSAGEVRNDGHGGCHMFSDWNVAKRMDKYGATLPKQTSDLGNGQTFTFEQSAESLVNDLLIAHLTERDVKKRMGKRILYTKPGSPAIYETKAFDAKTLAQFLSMPDTMAKLKADRILNLMPFADAVALYKANAK